ncbi:hypothetical protein CEXT_789291 [Caerostris extrusa]|uniref:Uncharacterized protein n=1 Tax=Caerostris extrusa TaxID=172846 RepID=A0AAV4VXY8_CAEEX|nr:hypothetical protein CEXT_789291 [Caerostris extrusa]
MELYIELKSYTCGNVNLQTVPRFSFMDWRRFPLTNDAILDYGVGAANTKPPNSLLGGPPKHNESSVDSRFIGCLN